MSGQPPEFPTIAPHSAKGIALRPYQERAVASILAAIDRGVRRGLVVMATGLGKTEVFSAVIGTLAQDPEHRSLVLAHRQELLHQAANRIGRRNPELSVAIEAARHRAPEDSRCIVGSVQTLVSPKRLPEFSPSIVVCDEAHHAAARTYRRVFERMGCFDPERPTFLLGVTATPHRLDNRALFGDENAIFEEQLFAYDIVAGIKDGYLADLRGYRAAAEGLDLSRVRTVAGDYDARALEREVNKEAINELAFSSWSQVAADRKTIVFCTGVDHAKAVVKVFREHGVAAESVDGTMKRKEREAVFSRFRTGETQVLTNCEIATEGFDDPATSCVLLLRPTQSWALFAQMVGRGLRVLPGSASPEASSAERRKAVQASGKPDCIVIDIVSNSSGLSVDRMPEEEEGAPNLNELVGLPPGMEMEGKTFAEAIEAYSKLPDGVKTSAFRRATNYEELSAALTQIEMIQELEMPGDGMATGTDLLWLKTGPMEYRIEVGGWQGEGTRGAWLKGEPGADWQLGLFSSHGRDDRFDLKGDLTAALATAEEHIRKRLFGVAALAQRNAVWRNEPATSAQIEGLISGGIDDVVAHGLTRGEAQSLLTVLRAQLS